MLGKFVCACLLMASVALALEEPIAIIAKHLDVHPDGSYEYNYETANGIKGQAVGEIKQFDKDVIGVARGDFSWTAPEGEKIEIQYVADENGYQPVGSHIPVPPAIPHLIQRALDYLATAPPPKEYVAEKHHSAKLAHHN